MQTSHAMQLSQAFIRNSGGLDHQFVLLFGGESAWGSVVKSTIQSTGFALLDPVANGLVMDPVFTAHLGHASAFRWQNFLQNAVSYGV